MARSADYTVQGFLYQFNKTLLQLLDSGDDDIITVEGIVEDIEVASTSGSLTAIQCKYHEAASVYAPSTVYKPLLQMLVHFYTLDSGQTHYVLFAHFPGSSGAIPVGQDELKTALESTNTGLTKYITQLTGVDLGAFLKRFRGEFGPSFEDLRRQVETALQSCGFSKDDIDSLAYPNAIQMVHDLAIKHDVAERSISRAQLVSTLHTIKKTTVSRWTLALKTRQQLLDARRKQLKPNLDVNTRGRAFLIHADSMEDFEAEAVTFIRDYIDKYHFKTAHIRTPLFCLNCSEDQFRDLQWRLFTNGIIANDGMVGGRFDETYFAREPLTRSIARGAIQREFHIRLVRWNADDPILNRRKRHDLFILGEGDDTQVDTKDLNVEVLPVGSFKEIKYMMGLSNVYE